MTDETLLLRFWVSVLPLSALAFGRLIKASATWEGSQRYGDIACTLVWDSLGSTMGCILQVPTHTFSMKTSQDMWKPVLPIYTSRPALIYVIHVSYSTLPSLCLWNESSSLLWPRVRGVVDCLKDPQSNKRHRRHMATLDTGSLGQELVAPVMQVSNSWQSLHVLTTYCVVSGSLHIK